MAKIPVAPVGGESGGVVCGTSVVGGTVDLGFVPRYLRAFTFGVDTYRGTVYWEAVNGHGCRYGYVTTQTQIVEWSCTSVVVFSGSGTNPVYYIAFR